MVKWLVVHSIQNIIGTSLLTTRAYWTGWPTMLGSAPWSLSSWPRQTSSWTSCFSLELAVERGDVQVWYLCLVLESLSCCPSYRFDLRIFHIFPLDGNEFSTFLTFLRCLLLPWLILSMLELVVLGCPTGRILYYIISSIMTSIGIISEQLQRI